MIQHPIPPLYDSDSRVLILGSFPSPKSREAKFFYGHPQNRFWKVMAEVLDWTAEKAADAAGSRADPSTPSRSASGDAAAILIPQTIPEKSLMLHTSHIAVWDTIASCDITGASDASITNVVPNDISVILDAAEIREIFCNGAKSHELYMKYIFPQNGRRALKLPSTSPANAACSVSGLVSSWSIIRSCL